MNEKDFSCYEQMETPIKCMIALSAVNLVVTIILIGLMISGFFISYKETYKDVYHTSFVNQDIIKQLYGVDIQYNKSIRKIEVIPNNTEKAFINEIIRKK